MNQRRILIILLAVTMPMLTLAESGTAQSLSATDTHLERETELIGLAAMSCRDGNANLAFTHALERAKTDPIKRAEVLTLYARCLINTHRRAAEAVPLLSEAIGLLPDRATPYFLLGTAYMQMGKDLEAASNFERTLIISPDHAETHFRLGFVRMRSVSGPPSLADPALTQRVLRQSEEHYRKAIELAPEHPAYHNGLGTNLLMQGKHEEAVREKLQAIELVPLHMEWTEEQKTFALGEFYLSLGQLYVAQGKRSLGEQMINTAIELVPPGRMREHLQLLGDMTLQRVPLEKQNAYQRVLEEASQKGFFDPKEGEQ